MIKLDLGTFGAVMKFAMELESKSLSFYEGAVEKAAGDELRSLLSLIKEKCDKRIATLERVRRENVTEMILEPIKGLESESYELDLDVPAEQDDGLLGEVAIASEETKYRFYEKAAIKIEFLIEASTTFERLADENQDNVDALRLVL